MNNIKHLSPRASYDELLGGVLLLDVRQEQEVEALAYEAPNQLNIPLDEIENRLDEIPTNVPIVVACKGGVRSVKAIELLQAEGYEQLYNLEGGIIAWVGEGLPVR